MVEPAKAEANAFDPLDEVVHRLGRPVRDRCLVPGQDVVPPAAERARERAQLFGHVVVCHVDHEFVEVGGSQCGIRDVVELMHGLFGVPAHAHFSLGVTGLEEPDELRLALFVETLVGLGEQPAAPIERVVLPAPVAEGVVLDAPGTLVDL